MQTATLVKRGEFAQLHGFLGKKQTASIADRVHHLKPWWRGGEREGSSTLGLVWYKFLEDGMPQVYHAQAVKYNQMLINQFPDLVAMITDIPELFEPPEGCKSPLKVLSRGEILGPYWSIFGFTISPKSAAAYDVDCDPEVGVPLPHFDYEGLTPYPSMLFDNATRAYTVTLSIEKAAKGGGLFIYHQRYLAGTFAAPSMSFGINGDKAFAEMVKNSPMTTLPYEPGTLTIFDSFMPHGIQLSEYSRDDEFRTVMIVHYLYCETPFPHWQYWM